MNRVNSVQELIERTQGMPLERMRFFINQDRREPMCFGIYYDMAGDRWVVYKNKADGSRAVRYSGPDEAYAANELWMKLQSEIDLRRARQADYRDSREDRREARRLFMVGGVVMALMLGAFGWTVWRSFHTPYRGYYRVNDDLYYYQDDYWYWYDDGDWVYYDAPDGEWWGDDYYGDDYPYFNNCDQPFEKSPYYEEPRNDSDSRSDSSDQSIFDSWDSGDTDWSSDW